MVFSHLKTEVITKIGAVFVQDQLSLPLPAIIIGVLFMEGTVETTVQIRPTTGTLHLSADKQISGNFFFTMVAFFHGLKIPAMADSCQEAIFIPSTPQNPVIIT